MENDSNKIQQDLFNKAFVLYKNKNYLSAFHEFYNYYELCKNEYSKCYLFLTAFHLDYTVNEGQKKLLLQTFKDDFKSDEKLPLDMYYYVLNTLKSELYASDTILYLQFGILAYNYYDTENAILIFNYALNKASYVKQREDVIHNLMLCYERIKDYALAKQYALTLHKVKISEIYYITKIILYNSKLLELNHTIETNEHVQLSKENENYFNKIKEIYSPLKTKNLNRDIILELISSLYFYLGKSLDEMYSEDLMQLKTEPMYEKFGLFYAYNEFVEGRKDIAINILKEDIEKINKSNDDQSNSYFSDYLTKIYYLNLLISFDEESDTTKFVKMLEKSINKNISNINTEFVKFLKYNICCVKIKNFISYKTEYKMCDIIDEIISLKKSDSQDNYDNLLDSFLYACCLETKLEIFTEAINYIKDNGFTEHLGNNIFKEIIQKGKKQFKSYIEIFKKCIEIKSFTSRNVVNKKEVLGHYTSIDNIKYLVRSDKNARIRMYNASYMNDPDEGKIILKELGLLSEDIDTLDKSENPNFLFCMSKKDKLPLWIDYGDKCNGCFLQLTKSSLIDKGKSDFVYLNKKEPTKATTDNNLNNADIVLDSVIYRYKAKSYKFDDITAYKVIYINKNSRGTIKTGIKELNVLIAQLKVLLKGISDKDDIVLLKILDEIRFLFKSSTYSTEEEIRIIKKVSDKSKYKLDDRPTLAVPKLFVEIENNNGIKFEEIMIGPKVSDENKMLLVPYIKFCDEKIEVTYSNINYR